MISLEGLLSKFKPYKNCDYEGAYFLTHVPTVGPLAYLHTIFEAADPEVQRKIIDRLSLPSELREFYRRYNGAHLFSDSLSLYGFFPKEYFYDRADLRKSWPYNIEDSNKEHFENWLSNSILLIGSYGIDRSRVFVEKASGHVDCSFGDNLNRTRASWPSFETWITEEIHRLSECFDEYGNRLVDLEETLPERG